MNFKSKIRGFPLWLIALGMIGSFLVGGYAAIQIETLMVPSSVTVVSSTDGLKLIAHDGTTVVTSIPWGNVAQGATQNWNGYMKNTGIEGLGSLSISSDLGSVGTVSWDIPAGTYLISGATLPVTISITITQSANLGTYPFTIEIGASPANATNVNVVITASDPNDPYLRFWAVTFDRPIPPWHYDGTGWADADAQEVHLSGETMTVLWSLPAGTHYLLFITSQHADGSGWYSGTITVNGQVNNFSGVDGMGHPAMINFTI